MTPSSRRQVPPPFGLTAQLQIAPLRIAPTPKQRYREWGPRSPRWPLIDRGPTSAPLTLAARDFPKKGGPIPLPPPPGTQHPPPPQLLPRPPNLIRLPVGGHSLLRTADFGPQTAGAAGGGRAAAQSSSPAAPLRVRGGGAPGFPLGLRGGRGIPRAAAGRGAGARRAPGWAGRRGDLLSSRGTHRRSGSPGFMRPGARRPAAQDDIKSPPPPAAPPRGQGRGGLRQDPPGRWEM